MLKLTIASLDATQPALPDASDPAVQVWRDGSGSLCAYSHTAGELSWIHLPGLASFSFTEGAQEVVALPRHPDRLGWIRDSFERTVLPMVLLSHGREALHASAVHAPCGVVALCAVSGTGKSTTALALSRRGYPLWADDAVVFDASRDRADALALPFNVRLLPDAASFFSTERPEESVAAGNPSGARQIGDRLPLAAVCILERTQDLHSGEAVETRQVSSVSAFLAVLAHAYCFSLQNTERKRQMVQHYLDLVARTPILRVRFRPGLERLEAILDGLEQTLTDL